MTLSRLQASLDVAARVLAPSVEAFDAPLRTRESLPAPGVCYPALRRLPGRDLHPLEQRSKKPFALPLARSCVLLRHGAPRAAAYARTATGGARELAVQHRHIAKHCVAMGLKLVRTYGDVGSGVAEDRQDLQRMLADAASPHSLFDVVIVTSRTRLTRDYSHVVAIEAILAHRGLQLLALNDGSSKLVAQEEAKAIFNSGEGSR